MQSNKPLFALLCALAMGLGLIGAQAGELWNTMTPDHQAMAIWFNESTATAFAFFGRYVFAALGVAGIGAVSLCGVLWLAWTQVDPASRTAKTVIIKYLPYVAGFVGTPILMLPVVRTGSVYSQLLALAVICAVDAIVFVALLIYKSFGPGGQRYVKALSILLAIIGFTNAIAVILDYSNYGPGLSIAAAGLAMALMQLRREDRHATADQLR
ncbi:hypothetical protein LP417_35695 (plasmid) [Polaromonas sp. P1-6]|nr:hypothetical protein LP417_35695 [Polaromonas sp. P1-6]